MTTPHKKYLLVAHPFLFAIYPILVIYFSNLNIFGFQHALTTIVYAVVTVAILLALSFVTLRNVVKGGIVVTLLIAWFYLYKAYNEGIIELFKTYLYFHFRGRYSISIWCVLFILSLTFLIRTRSSLDKVAVILNVTAIVMILLTFAMNLPGSPFRVKLPDAGPLEESVPSELEEAASISTETIEARVGEEPIHKPDVYYIIVDSYARYDVLKHFFDFDNKEFYNYLHAKGFYVAENSLANYQNTRLSLASSLNMEYLDPGTIDPRKGLPDKLNDRTKTLKNIMKDKGYAFVYVGNDEDKLVDENFVQYLMYQQLINYSIFYQLQYLIPFNQDTRRARADYAFKELIRVSTVNESKFVFAYIFPPHPPFFVFGPNGEGFSLDKIWLLPKLGLIYTYHVRYVNRKLQEAIDSILLNSRRPPIIILQSDHGSVINNPGLSRSAHNKDFLLQRMAILNAYHLPEGGKHLLYPSISPVNTFRLILNRYFGENYDLLNDDSWFVSYDESGKKVTNVTERLLDMKFDQ